MEILLKAKNLSKQYVKTTGFFARSKTVINALDKISISIKKGITLAVVGESGSGKSTLAKSLIRLIDLDNGSITFKNKNMRTINGDVLKSTRKNIQMIFQDPYASLNPRMRILKIMEEPLKVHNLGDSSSRYSKILSMIKRVGLVEDDLLNSCKSRHISNAVLDVYRTEPLPKNHSFWQQDNIRLWPHVAAETNPNTAAKQIANAIKCIDNNITPPNTIDRAIGY